MRRLEIEDKGLSPTLPISQSPNLCPKNNAPVEKERGRCLKNQADGL